MHRISKNITRLVVASLVFLAYNLNAKTILFEHVNLIPMDMEIILYDQNVLVIDDKIVSITPFQPEQKYKSDQKINCRGKYMMPGLVDAHFHQTGKSIDDFKLQFNLLIANGVTSAISMMEWDGQDTIGLRDYASRKDNLAPYYVTAGPGLDAATLKNPDDAIKMVAYHKQRGYDFIKLHGNIDKETYLTLLREAEKNRIPVVGHAQRNMPLEYSLRLALIAHMEEITMVFSDENKMEIVDMNELLAMQIAKDVKNSGIYLSPTLSIMAGIENFTDDDRFKKFKTRSINQYLSPATFKENTLEGKEYRSTFFLSPQGKELVRKIIASNKTLTLAMHKAGVPLLVGSDNFGLQITGFSLHDEMQQMNEAGIPAFDVLKAATVTGTRYLNRSAVAGTISEGKNAEFVILAKNPLDNINNTREIEGVMLKGQWLNKKRLDNLLRDVKTAQAKL